MDRRKQRSEAEWQSLISELQAMKRKLHSKTEALLIISKDLDVTQKERDQFKLMAEKLRVRCQAYKRQFSDYPLTHDQATLLQMLRDARNQKIAHQKQCEVLQQKLNEALGDVKLLRERFARQRIGDEGIGPRHFPAHEREELVEQLETAKQQAEHFRQEFDIASDQIVEIRAEKDDFRLKSDRLNEELNFMLNGDKKRIIDIDALCMENKYLQERVKQCQEEKNSLHAQLSKMKGVLNSRKSSNTDIVPGKIRNSGLVISPKQVKEILLNRSSLPTSAETVSDLQSIAAALLETINDKNLALHHLRNTNKILGNRVSELEKKLRTFEVGGLWNMNGESQTSPNPKIIVEKSGEINEEFFSSLGSRLSKLTDVCSKSFQEYKLVSLTPESSGSTSDVTRDDDATRVTEDLDNINHDATQNSADDSTAFVADSSEEIDNINHGISFDATDTSNDASPTQISNITGEVKDEASGSIPQDAKEPSHDVTCEGKDYYIGRDSTNNAISTNAAATGGVDGSMTLNGTYNDASATSTIYENKDNGINSDCDDISHAATTNVTGFLNTTANSNKGDATVNNFDSTSNAFGAMTADATATDPAATAKVLDTNISDANSIPVEESYDGTDDTATIKDASVDDATDADNPSTAISSTGDDDNMGNKIIDYDVTEAKSGDS